MDVFVCDFELIDRGERVVAIPVGLSGATEGYDFEDALRMAADWLYETALDYLMEGEALPDLPIGTKPSRGGQMVTLAVRASLEQVPAVTAAEAARVLNVSTARISQLCKSGLLESWKVGGTRMVSRESVDARADEERRSGRPKKDAVTTQTVG